MKSTNFQNQGTQNKKPRKISLFIEYSMAHSQNADMIRSEWKDVIAITQKYPERVMNAAGGKGKKELGEMGFELDKIIVSDGLPQWFPTSTAGFEWSMKRGTNSENDFIRRGGYDGWIPEYGTKCRGPLPPTSKLAEINELVRKRFKELGHDKRFYL